MPKSDATDEVPIDLLTPGEVADLLRIGRSALYEWIAAGKLPHYRLGRAIRLRRLDVAQFLKERREDRPTWRRRWRTYGNR